jgi:hypothetical protein
MAVAPFLLYTFSLALLSLAYDDQDVFGILATMHNSTDPLNTCDQIAMAISGISQVFFPRKRVILPFRLRYSNLIGDQAAPEYLLDIAHASASSSEPSACSVEAGSTKDLSEIVRHPDQFHLASSHPHLLASYLGIYPNAFCGERWRTRH